MSFIKVKKHVFYVFYLQMNVFNIYGSFRTEIDSKVYGCILIMGGWSRVG